MSTQETPWRRFYPEYLNSFEKEQQEFTKRMDEHTSLADLLKSASQEFSDKTAFTTCMPNGMFGSLSYSEIDAYSDAFAYYLRKVIGLREGSRVALQCPNSLPVPVVAFGVIKASCVLVNVNPLYTAIELEHQLSDCEAEAIVIVDMFVDKLEEIIAKTKVKHVFVTSVCEWFPPLVSFIIRMTQKYWNRSIPEHGLTVERLPTVIEKALLEIKNSNFDVATLAEGLNKDSLVALQYTGGTTGIAKGACLSHGNLLANLHQVSMLTDEHIARGEDCVMTALPLYHIFAFSINLLMFYSVGSHNVLVPSPRPIQNCQRAFDNFPINWLSGVNTLFNALLNEEWFNVYPPREMKIALAGGTALHRVVAEKWQSIVKKPIVEGYGLTETSPVCCFNPIGGEVFDSIGVPIPQTKMLVLDEDEQVLDLGEVGELVVQGPQVMQGYWQREDETSAAIKDGWFHTGDIGFMNEDGYFFIVDRKKDTIIVSGFNVYPNEIEECISRIPEVQESAVIGLKDAKTGEAVCACVVLRDQTLTAQQIIDHCRHELTAYKVPKKIIFRDELPKSPIGKVLRRQLRDEYRKKLS